MISLSQNCLQIQKRILIQKGKKSDKSDNDSIYSTSKQILGSETSDSEKSHNYKGKQKSEKIKMIHLKQLSQKKLPC